MSNFDKPESPAGPGPGSIINNRYRLKAGQGSWSYGQVYLAENIQATPPRPVTLKWIDPKFIEDRGIFNQILETTNRLAKLNQPGIQNLVDFEIWPDRAYVVSEYSEGGTLAGWLQTNPAGLPLEQVKYYLAQLGPVLDAAHQAGLIHGEIKAQNILLDRQGKPFFSEFGLGIILGRANQSDFSLNGEAMFYTAPEIIAGKVTNSKESDIYALGVLAFLLLTGQPPYQGQVSQVAMGHINAPVPDITRLKPGYLPAGLNLAFQKVLAKRPEDRFQTAAEFLNMVNNPPPIQAYPPPVELRNVPPEAYRPPEVGGPDPAGLWQDRPREYSRVLEITTHHSSGQPGSQPGSRPGEETQIVRPLSGKQFVTLKGGAREISFEIVAWRNQEVEISWQSQGAAPEKKAANPFGKLGQLFKKEQKVETTQAPVGNYIIKAGQPAVFNSGAAGDDTTWEVKLLEISF